MVFVKPSCCKSLILLRPQDTQWYEIGMFTRGKNITTKTRDTIVDITF